MRTACMLWGNVKPGWSYTLPVASASVLGGIKIGSGLTIDGSGVVSVTGGGGATNLGYTASPISGLVTSDTGTDATVPLVGSVNAGLMSPGDKTKLDGVATNADKYSRWFVETSYGTTPVFSASIVEFVAGAGITIADNLTAGHQILTFSATGAMVYPGAGIPISTGSAWGTSIANNSANWNTAYGWGNHAGLYTPLSHKTTEDALNGLVRVNGAGGYSAVTDNSTNWNSAYTNMGKVLVNGLASYYTLSDVYFLQEYGYIRPAFGSISYANPLPVTGGAIYGALQAKQNTITLTTNGSSGAATLINDVLNIPQYSGGTNYWETDAYGIYRSSPVAINGANTIGYDQTVHGRASFRYTGGAVAYAISSESNGTLANFYAANTGANGAGIYCDATGTGSFGGIFKGQRSDLKVSMNNTAPASATDTGQVGEIRFTAGYIYVCTATNTWVRAALATW